jgi:hypothetical protein
MHISLSLLRYRRGGLIVSNSTPDPSYEVLSRLGELGMEAKFTYEHWLHFTSTIFGSQIVAAAT